VYLIGIEPMTSSMSSNRIYAGLKAGSLAAFDLLSRARIRANLGANQDESGFFFNGQKSFVRVKSNITGTECRRSNGFYAKRVLRSSKPPSKRIL
jgi:hypothetical protein